MCSCCLLLYLLWCSVVLSQVKCSHEGCTRTLPYHPHGYHHLCGAHKGDAKPAPAIVPAQPPPHECSVAHFLTPESSSSSHSHLSDFQRGAIAAFHSIGFSNEKIAMITRVDVRSIKKWIERAHDHLNLRDRPRCGRPAVLTEEEKTSVIAAAADHPRRATPPQLFYELDLGKVLQHRNMAIDSSSHCCYAVRFI